MNDLEDHIFKQNVPGRYSSWVEEDHHAGDESGGTTEDDKDDATDNYERNQQIKNNSKLHHQHQNASSYCYSKLGGVKGVLADYKLYRHYELQKQETNQNYFTDNCEKKSECRVESSREQQEKSNCDSHQNDEKNSSQPSSQDDDKDEDDDFIQKYRMKQIERWKAAQLQHRTCVYGELVEVDPIQFAEIVDKEEQSNVTVFILLYENCIPECITLLRYMESIARSMTFARFLCLRAFAVDPTFDSIALPALMVYQNGQLVGNFVRVCEELKPFTEDTVKKFLSLFCSPLAGMCNNSTPMCRPEFSDDEELEEFCSDFHSNLK